MNQNRRVFRGRGGPTDRRLPKHNARRRRPPPPSSKLGGEAAAAAAAAAAAGNDEDSSAIISQEQQQEQEPTPSPVSAAEDDDAETSALAIVDLDNDGLDTTRGRETPVENAERSESGDGDDASSEEILHLTRRIRNNRETMQCSKSLVVPSNYKRLVLDAVQNTVGEWRAVISARNRPTDVEASSANDDDDHDAVSAGTGRAVFELVQQSLQCGPLTGSKPGYMKRCGSEVATMVFDLLNAIIGSQQSYTTTAISDTEEDETDKKKKTPPAVIVDHLMKVYCWTEKQATAIETWRGNAKKAIEKSKPVSKSLLKKQKQVADTKNKNKKQAKG